MKLKRLAEVRQKCIAAMEVDHECDDCSWGPGSTGISKDGQFNTICPYITMARDAGINKSPSEWTDEDMVIILKKRRSK